MCRPNIQLLENVQDKNLCREVSNVIWNMRPLALEIISHEILMNKSKVNMIEKLNQNNNFDVQNQSPVTCYP